MGVNRAMGTHAYTSVSATERSRSAVLFNDPIEGSSRRRPLFAVQVHD